MRRLNTSGEGLKTLTPPPKNHARGAIVVRVEDLKKFKYI